MTNLDIDKAIEWLKTERCPHCVSEKRCSFNRKITEKLGGGYRCWGYRSKYFDEPMWRK